jgi:hypothetical protein
VVLGGIVVCVLAIGPKIRGLKPCRRLWIFKGNKNFQHSFLRREVKPSIPCCKILWHVKETSKYQRDNS